MRGKPRQAPAKAEDVEGIATVQLSRRRRGTLAMFGGIRGRHSGSRAAGRTAAQTKSVAREEEIIGQVAASRRSHLTIQMTRAKVRENPNRHVKAERSPAARHGQAEVCVPDERRSPEPITAANEVAHRDTFETAADGHRKTQPGRERKTDSCARLEYIRNGDVYLRKCARGRLNDVGHVTRRHQIGSESVRRR